MPAKNKSTITPYSSPRERFQSVDGNLKAHHDMVDKDAFANGMDAALAQFVTDESGRVKDMNTAAAAGYRIQGAVDFLLLHKTLAEMPKPTTDQTMYENLVSTDHPRRV